MSELDRDSEVSDKGRTETLAANDEVIAPLRDQIPEKLAEKLASLNVGTKLVNVWRQGNIARQTYLDRTRKMLVDYDEFIDPIYSSPTEWSSTLHLPISLTHAKTFHARMFSAIFAQDPPFTMNARSAPNQDRAPLIQDLMRYAVKDWANEYQGVEETVDRWLWDWVVRGSGILKARWLRKFTKFEDVEEVFELDTELRADNPLGETQEVPIQRKVERINQTTITTFQGPELMRVAPEDLVIIGGEGDPQRADHVIQPEMLTSTELHSLADQGIFKKEAVKAVIDSGDDFRSEDVGSDIKQEQALIAGMEYEPVVATNRYKILECYTKIDIDRSGIGSDVIVWVHVKSGTILRATYLWRVNKNGRRPYFKADFYKRPGQEWGVGIIELMWTITQEIDAIHNIRIDTGLITSIPWGFFDPGTSMRKDKLPIEPGALLPLSDPTRNVLFPNLGNRTGFGLQEESLLNTVLERLTSINDLTLGTNAGQGVLRTATGVRQSAGETNANLDIFLRRINRAWKQALTYIFQMLQDKVPEGLQFRVTGDDGSSFWREIKTREDIKGMFDFELEPNSANSNPQIRLSNASQVYQLTQNPLDFQLGIITPTERFESIKNLLQAMGIRDFGRFIRKPVTPPRIFTPLELANRILAGVDEPLTPEQDLQGFISWVDNAMGNDEILGQFDEMQVRALIAKKNQAQAMSSALQEMAAQTRNAQQIQTNTALGTTAQTPTPLQGPVGAIQ